MTSCDQPTLASGTATSIEVPARIGRYEVTGILGSGGMGIVYAAYDADLERRVAVKVLRTGAAADGNSRVRLLREARAMARLAHRNVITVYEVGTDVDVDFVAMELIDGRSAADWLRSTTPADSAGLGVESPAGLPSAAGPLATRTRREVLRVFRHAGDGLAAAHAAGLVHRDFKPHNVLLGRDGRVVVTDFGLARVADESPVVDGGDGVRAPARPVSGLEETIDATSSDAGFVLDPAPSPSPWTSLTRTGAVLGTPAYMAPEQYGGASVDARSDQFSFCVALWEGLTGARPFAGQTIAQVRWAIENGVLAAAGRELPRRLRSVLVRGLDPDPARRWPSMQALLGAIAAASAWPRRIALASVAAAVLAAATAAVAIAWPHAAAAPCAVPASAIDPAWSPARRSALPAGLAELVAPAFDRVRDQWLAARTTACAAPAAPAAGARLACLRDTTDQLDALVAVVASAPADRVRAADVAGMVPEPEACAGDVPPAVGPPAGDAARSIRRDVVQLRLDVRAAALDDLDGRSARLVEAARASGSCTVHAEALIAAAEAMQAVEDPDAARRHAEAAAIEADRCDHDLAGAAAAVALAENAASQHAPAEQVTARIDRAEAALDRAGRPLSLLARLRLTRTRVDDRLDRDRLITGLEEVLPALVDAGRIVDAAEVAMIAAVLHQLRNGPGDVDQARRMMRKGASDIAAGLGAAHPRVARAGEHLSRLLWELGDVDAASTLREQVRAYWRSPAGARVVAARRARPTSLEAVSGQVIDGAGRPVAGVHVVAAPIIVGDSRDLVLLDFGAGGTEHPSVSVTTDLGGRFRLAAPAGSSIAAEAGALRSLAAAARDGVVLRLAATGRIEGRVTFASPRPGLVVVGAAPRSGQAYALMAPVDAQGGFALERLPPDRYDLWVQVEEARNAGVIGHRVDVNAAETTRAELTWSKGSSAIEVVVRADRGVIEAAQVWMLSGPVEIHRYVDLIQDTDGGLAYRSAIADQAHPGSQRRARELGGDVYVRIDGVTPGAYTVCVVPLSHELADRQPELMLGPYLDQLHVACRRVTVDDATSQVVVIETSPMKRLSR